MPRLKRSIFSHNIKYFLILRLLWGKKGLQSVKAIENRFQFFNNSLVGYPEVEIDLSNEGWKENPGYQTERELPNELYNETLPPDTRVVSQ